MSTSTSVKNNYSEHSGEPGCLTAGEVHKVFRNFWDPTAFWECEAQGKSAKLKRCGASELYSEEHGKCVHYTEWVWSEPKEPPSRPKSK